MLNSLAKYFLRGLLFVVPFAVTVYVLWAVFAAVDGWLDLEFLIAQRIPGLGFVVTLVLITMIGFLASNLATRWVFFGMDRVFRRLPLVKLLYTSVRDVIGAFVGDEKRFDRPVRVAVGANPEISVLGFLTREDLSEFGFPEHASVYVPQSYNFAGNLIVVPHSRLRALDADSVGAMAFIVSAGVAGSLAPAAQGAKS